MHYGYCAPHSLLIYRSPMKYLILLFIALPAFAASNCEKEIARIQKKTPARSITNREWEAMLNGCAPGQKEADYVEHPDPAPAPKFIPDDVMPIMQAQENKIKALEADIAYYQRAYVAIVDKLGEKIKSGCAQSAASVKTNPAVAVELNREFDSYQALSDKLAARTEAALQRMHEEAMATQRAAYGSSL